MYLVTPGEPFLIIQEVLFTAQFIRVKTEKNIRRLVRKVSPVIKKYH